jgi:amino acid transporter
MAAKAPGWSGLGKLALALLLTSLLLFVVCTAHMMVTGMGVPYQDATPEQVAYERFHNGIAMSLILGVMLSSLASFVVVTAWVSRWFIRKLRAV